MIERLHCSNPWGRMKGENVNVAMMECEGVFGSEGWVGELYWER